MKNIIRLVSIMILLVVITGCGFYGSNGESNKKTLANTKWKTTDGLELIFTDSSCYLARNGSKTSDTCYYTPNASGTGVEKLMICTLTGQCQTKEFDNGPGDWIAFAYYYSKFYRQ